MESVSAPNLTPKASQMPECPAIEIPLIKATDETLDGFGRLVSDARDCEIEIVQWPAPGWRPVERGTGNEGGTTEGVFACRWQGCELHTINEAVGGNYIAGWSREPFAMEGAIEPPVRERVFMWHANYHPDGGQLFFPIDTGAFVAPLALPNEDVNPHDFVAFWFDGAKGLYIHPDVWHEGVFPVNQQQRFFDKQGKVHARINVEFVTEFQSYLSFALTENEPCPS